MKLSVSHVALATCAFGLLALPVSAQTAAQPAKPAAGQDALPPVDVVQPKQNTAKKAPAKKAVAKKSTPKAAPVEPTPVAADEPVDAPASDAPVRAGTGGIASGTVNMSPVSGSELPIEKVPTSVGRASSEDFTRMKEFGAQQTLQATVPGVFMNDQGGNVFQGGVQFRGFESSPINGAPQGIAVYQNGTRINEVFGDVVNWDFLPSNAIDSITVLGSNPVYGLNAIGGAIGITMRDGFNFQGVELDSRFGSYGRKQGSAAVGVQAGNWGIFGAIEGIKDDGYRDFGDSEIKRMYADLGYRTSQSEFHLSFTGADNRVGVTAAAPEVMLDLDWSNTFTSPQINENEMWMTQLSGVVKATSTLTLAGQAYYRNFKQEKVDGNILAVTTSNAYCRETPNDPATGIGTRPPDADEICILEGGEGEEAQYKRLTGSQTGRTRGLKRSAMGLRGRDDPLNTDKFGVIDMVDQDNQSFGGSVQAVDRSTLFGFRNQFLVGTSWDHGEVAYNTRSQLGLFQPNFVVKGLNFTVTSNPATSANGTVAGAPVYLDGDDFFPRDIDTTSDYFGVYFSNTTELTDRLALTLGGRFNYAHLDIDLNSRPAPPTEEPFVDKLSGEHDFHRFNPTVGLTYQLFNGLTAFGGYSEANRAPTAAELSCADPDAPCLIESLLVADPPLEQVVSKTFEIGLRGNVATFGREHALSWSLTGFHTRNEDDIISIAAPRNGRGFFDNVGQTQRQGVEAALQYRNNSLFTYGSYAFTDATFRENLIISTPDNPKGQEICPGYDYDDARDEAEDLEDFINTRDGTNTEVEPFLPKCSQVRKGDRLPGIPRHKFKAGFNYFITSKWAFGSDMVAYSDQVFFGDEGNDNDRLQGFAKFNLHTTYQVTDNVQIYGLVDNVFDTRYGLFGTYYNTDGAEYANKNYPAGTFEDDASHKTKIPAPPVTAYGGVKVRF